jgi:hypothetical protein
MSAKRWIMFILLAWLATVSILHLWLNLRAFDFSKSEAHSGSRFRVGFLPVT